MNFGLEFWSDVIGAAGAAALFPPAAAANKIRKAAARLDASLRALTGNDPAISPEELAAFRAQIRNIKSLESSWSASDEHLLWFALMGFLVSFILKILHHVSGT